MREAIDAEIPGDKPRRLLWVVLDALGGCGVLWTLFPHSARWYDERRAGSDRTS